MSACPPALTAHLSMLQQVGGVLPVGIMIADTTGKVHYHNHLYQEWLPGYHLNDSLWSIQLQTIASQNKQPTSPSSLAVSDSAPASPQEVSLHWQEQKLAFRIVTQPLHDEDKQLCGVIEITENITELRHNEEALAQSRRFETVGRLASGIAHDFNNILQVINGHSEMLLERHRSDSKLQKSLDVILTSGQKASSLTRQLLMFSRRKQNEFRHLNLGNLLFGMQKILCRMLGEDVAINYACHDHKLFIDGDESQLEQVIMNLAVNARDAMPSGGSIDITIGSSAVLPERLLTSLPGKVKDSPHHYLTLTFADSGSGIQPGVLGHIFEPFFTTKEASKGTGLGLATVYSIIRQHAGYILVDSTPGKGTSFIIYLPLCFNDHARPEAEEQRDVPEANSETVLIIEDDELVRDLASQVLTNNGFTVECASNLAQAHEILELNTFDLFLIDIVLPDGNGVDFIESVRASHPDAAFILSSGYTEDKPQIKETLQKGYAFLHKPYTINTLLSTCTEALSKVRHPHP